MYGRENRYHAVRQDESGGRVLLRERITAGDSDAEVVDFLVARYGEFILLKPRFNWHTVLLWATPPAVLAIGALVAVLGYRRRRQAVATPVALDSDEQEALRRLISERESDPNITES